MIKDNIFYAENYYMEGFEISNPSSMVISVTAGAFVLLQEQLETVPPGEGETTTQEPSSILVEDTVHQFPEFSFDVIPDHELEVNYDIYLLEGENKIRVERTEMGLESLAKYRGDDPMLHCLMTFTMPAGTTDLSNIQITVNRVMLDEN